MAARPPADLATFGEWGGRAWVDQIRIGLDWLGDVRELRMLEIGTRYGRMATWFALHGASVLAVDVDAAPLVEARRFAEQHGVGHRVDFATYDGDPRNLTGSFDVVFAKSVIVLMDIDAAADGFADRLRPGGRLLAIENARGPLALHAARMVRRRSWRPHGATYLTSASVDALRRRFEVDLERWTMLPPTVVIGARRRSM